MFRRRTFLLAAILLFAARPCALADEPSGTLSGRVVDPLHAPVAGATVTLRHTESGFERTGVTDGSGAFVFDALDSRAYHVSASSPGFSLAAILVALGRMERRDVTIVLEIGTFTEEVVVMTRRLAATPETVRRIPGSVHVIDRRTLEASRVFTVNEALRKVPGVNVRDEEGFALRPNIGIRGLNPTRSSKTLLLEDGIPLTYAPYGDNASYYHPPIERFSSVEILKGSGQIAYGPVTVGGVINYVTPDPTAEPAGSLTIVGGNRDYFNGRGSYSTTVRNVGFLVDYMRKQGDGARDNIHSRLNDVNAKVVARLTDRQTLTLRNNYYSEDSNVTYSGLREDEYHANALQNPFKNDFAYFDRLGASASHVYAFTPRLVLTTNFYASRFTRDWWRQSSNSGQRPNDDADPKCRGMANLDTTCGNEGRLRRYATGGVEPRVRYGYRFFGVGSEAEFGARAHFEVQERRQRNGDTPTARSGVLVENNQRTNQAYSSFVQNRLLLGRWTVTPGLRVEHVEFRRSNRLAADGAGVTGRAALTQLVPGVGASFDPSERFTWFAGVHRGFAPPRTEDVITNSGGVVELDAELSWNSELGVRSLPAPGIRLETTWFRMDYQNQVVPANLAGGVGATLTNGGKTLHQGLEVSTRLDTGALRRSVHNVYASLAYTFIPDARFTGVRFSGIPGFQQVGVTGNRLPYAPQHLLNTTLGYEHPRGVGALVEAVRVSSQFGDDLNTSVPTPDGQRGPIPGYTVWNGTLNYRVRRSTMFVTVKNLFDTLYIADRARGILPGAPRLVQAGMRVEF